MRLLCKDMPTNTHLETVNLAEAIAVSTEHPDRKALQELRSLNTEPEPQCNATRPPFPEGAEPPIQKSDLQGLQQCIFDKVILISFKYNAFVCRPRLLSNQFTPPNSTSLSSWHTDILQQSQILRQPPPNPDTILTQVRLAHKDGLTRSSQKLLVVILLLLPRVDTPGRRMGSKISLQTLGSQQAP